MVAAARFELAPPKRLVSEEIYRLHTTEFLFCEIKESRDQVTKYGNFTSAPFCIKIIGRHNIGGNSFWTELSKLRITQLNRKTHSEAVLVS